MTARLCVAEYLVTTKPVSQAWPCSCHPARDKIDAGISSRVARPSDRPLRSKNPQDHLLALCQPANGDRGVPLGDRSGTHSRQMAAHAAPDHVAAPSGPPEGGSDGAGGLKQTSVTTSTRSRATLRRYRRSRYCFKTAPGWDRRVSSVMSGRR